MEPSQNKSMIKDVLGIAPIAEATKKVTDGVMDGAAALLSRICLPAAEEFGLLLKDRVASWRRANADAIAASAQEKLNEYQPNVLVQVHPRIASKVVEEGSWAEDQLLQQMWGGLLAASCKPAAPNDQNLIYTNLLTQLTALEVKFLNIACERCPKAVNPQGLLIAFPAGQSDCDVTLAELMSMLDCNDIHVLDRDLDHLRTLGLIHGGIIFDVSAGIDEITTIDMTPTILALNLYVACQGYVGSAGEYFNAPTLRDNDWVQVMNGTNIRALLSDRQGENT